MAETPLVTEQARRLPFAQLILLMAVGVVTLGAALIDVHLITPVYIVGVVAIALFSALTLMVGRMRVFDVHPRLTVWIAVIPVLDIVAYTFIRADVVGVLPSVGVLIIFPVAWLAFAFPWPALAAGVAATLVVTGYALAVASVGGGVRELGDWVRLLTLPLLILLFAMTTHFVARDLAARQLAAREVERRAREAERSSAETALTIEALGETTLDALAVFAPDGRPVLLNSAAAALGARAGKPDLLHAEGPAEVYDEDRTTLVRVGLTTVQSVLDGELAAPRRVWVGPPGDQVAVSVLARPVIGPEGEVIAVVIVGHDVTALVEAIEVRDAFLDTVGHELKTPLTAILGHADLLAASSDDPAVARTAATIEGSAERLLGIVNQLIAAGRSRLSAEPDAISVDERVALACAEGEAAARVKGVDFALVTEDAAGRVHFVPSDFDALLRAVIGNAVLFTPPGGAVVVGSRREGSEMVVDVSDTGVGMTEEQVRRAFDRFYRAADARQQAVPGLGLGLTIAQAHAVANGASLAIESAPGRGTVITLRMPAV